MPLVCAVPTARFVVKKLVVEPLVKRELVPVRLVVVAFTEVRLVTLPVSFLNVVI